jgi:predicted RecB family nuclease
VRKNAKDLRVCSKGHRYYKSSACPVCPVCENEQRPKADFLRILSGPARRALENTGIDSLKKLSTWSKTDLLKLHGLGPSSIPKLNNALQQKGLTFRKK